MNCKMFKLHDFIKLSSNKFLFHRFLSGDKSASNQLRVNEVNIQMINDKFHKVLFGNECSKKSDLSTIFSTLKKFNIDLDKTTLNETVDFDLPPLLGENIAIHLEKTATDLNETYLSLLNQVINWKIPPIPTKWSLEEGWTKYSDEGWTRADAPVGDALVFDVETLPSVTERAVMAVALAGGHWHSWTSHFLYNRACNSTANSSHKEDLIPLYGNSDTARQKCVIGHFVSFDRARILDEYQIKGTGTRFIDTMSLHIAIRGLTSIQRSLKISYNKNKTDNKIWKQYFGQNRNMWSDFSGDSIELSDKWLAEATLNSLADVYRSYFPQCDMADEKDKREIFIKGTIDDIIKDFQSLMSYCANDVLMTFKIFKELWSEYQIRFPHPASLTGMLEMGSLYLPVNKNFNAFIDKATSTYNRIAKQEKDILMKLAQTALEQGKNEQHTNDPWLWDLDWAISSKSNVPKWYKELMKKKPEEMSSDAGSDAISSQMRIAAKLLKLKWDGMPLHYDKKMKWGVLIPGRYSSEYCDEKFMDLGNGNVLPIIPVERLSPKKIESLHFPLKKYIDFWIPMFVSRLDKISNFLKTKKIRSSSYHELVKHVIESMEIFDLSSEHHTEIFSRLNSIQSMLCDKFSETKLLKNFKPSMYDFQINDLNNLFKANKPLCPSNPDIPFVWFLPLPHENGEGNFVGSPLSKSFLNHLQTGRLTSHGYDDLLESIIEGKKSGVFWRNYQKRVLSQIVVQTSNDNSENTEFAILPQVVVAGTVTRRAVEKLWLTATNAVKDKIGSEIKAMVQPPSGWVIVGADVDSQEQWIAALLGDSIVGIHGGTPFGWLVLQGSKTDGTDLHSKTSKLIGISRDSAKVLNYARMYGAGIKKSTDTLLKFNPEYQLEEASLKIKSLMLQTKGRKTPEGWVDGIESQVFSKLEQIAQHDQPKTPILNAMLSRSLEKSLVDDKFMNSKCNWVVQSSGVDYLHCLLTFTKSLISQYKVNARLCMCIHDEIRYLCEEKDKYRMALILQIANLFTRSLFAIKLGINDLPQSVAFFSEIDIDHCLRKNPDDDCQTPSNQEGLLKNYQIEKGESLNIYQLLEKTGGKLL